MPFCICGFPVVVIPLGLLFIVGGIRAMRYGIEVGVGGSENRLTGLPAKLVGGIAIVLGAMLIYPWSFIWLINALVLLRR